MKRAFFCLGLFVSLVYGVKAVAAAYFPPLQPVQTQSSSAYSDPFTNQSYSSIPNINYPKIDKIEHSMFGKIYSTQDIKYRLDRIEKSIFSTTYSSLSLAQRVDNIVVNYNKVNGYPDISQRGLSNIEKKVFGQNFTQEEIPLRIERLEQSLLGAVQGGDLASRYETIKTASTQSNRIKNPLTNPNFYASAIPAAKTNGIKGFLSTIGNFLFGGGMMTGFSPSLDSMYNGYNSSPYSTNSYNNSYNNGFMNMGGMNPGNGVYRGTRTNTGWTDDYSSYGSGSSVTILD